ncbi:MAG: aminotransferase class I/II-fold pyridoxal phosphate-dependent enzyme [Candidatus Aminicenantes bacterium]|nr:aminotransferase class I/II-fold pyridoxal phosphate-dependent enzyme [Candidatus Aminicenantes bacterium]TFG57998.1 MAG: aminotransferase class I/II-fold pyridoxal phosphate-dependent enzyme [Candidatus Aminicenantes bacterium]
MITYSDFRSDTVTRPTEKMRKAMAEAVVGDDVLGDDPTVQKLELLAAETMGKEAALFCPSGTMANAIAVKMWTGALEEVIVEERSHIYNMESTHMTFISGVTPRPVRSERGAMDPRDVAAAVRKPNVHTPRTSLICLENTHNNWGGAVLPLDNFKAIRKIADENGLRVHLDGARIFNASQASGVPVKEYAGQVDSLMFCLSKGLSAPAGSMLVANRERIEFGRRLRKALGGGMRQVGVLAAPGIIALTEMVDRLKDDHARAKKLARGIAGLPGVKLAPESVETDILIFGFEHPTITVPAMLGKMKEKGILALAVSGGIRMVTHKDVGDEDVDRAVKAFREILAK